MGNLRSIIMANRWLISDSPGAFRAELRPDPRRAAIVGGLASGSALLCAAVALALRSNGWWVAAIVLACFAAFPVTLFFGLRRSVYSVVLDFEAVLAEVQRVRSFDPPAHLEVGLAEVDLAAEGTCLILSLRGQPETDLTVETESLEMPTSVLDRAQAALAR